jgi:cytochrome c biogenesis protein CcmG/thiol:disulfide interchange protein DsbE
MAKSRRSATQASWLVPALVLFAAALFGLLALPQLAPQARQAKDFLLPRLDPKGGASPGKLRLSDLQGKGVILDFWASWCQPCRVQAPIVDRVAKRNAARGLVALGVVSGDTAEDAAAFLAQHPVGYESVVDDQGQATRAFQVTGLPTIVAISPKGEIVAVRKALVSEKELSALIEAIVPN